jgi:ribulose-5-phosphate 4-epimerase/fuculose-1-phosphate aldolase
MTAPSPAAAKKVAIATRILSEVGLAEGATCTFGHASMRDPDDPTRFLIKGRGYEVDSLALMRPEEVIACDLEGAKVHGPRGITPPLEVKLHSCLYKANPKVMGVVHVHPRFATMMSVIGAQLRPMCVEGMHLVRNGVPVYPNVRLITTEDHGMEVAQTLGQGKAALLLGHGAVTADESVEGAVTAMIDLEEQAKMNWYATCAAGKDHPSIPEKLIDDWTESMKGVRNLAHLKDPDPDPQPRKSAPPIGIWPYLAHVVSRDL